MFTKKAVFTRNIFARIASLILLLTLPASITSETTSPNLNLKATGIIRHDRDIERYRALGGQGEFACVGRYAASASSGDYATGVLISPLWVLTAAHFVEDSSVWWFGDSIYRSVQIVKHPGLSTVSEDRKAQWDGWDLALVRLNRPVLEVTPAIRWVDGGELASRIVKIGYGYIGDGSTGMNTPATQERLGGENTIDAIGGTIAGIDLGDDVLACDFDSPKTQVPNYLGSAIPLDLEIGGSKGDSGGGAFIKRNGQWQLAGIVSGGVSREITYGSVILLARVSSANPWIDSVLNQVYQD
ncbi:MAG: hypothetical protein DHS20C17_31080 [Cyclobacteriaceae bacterium]|nr:MAG: hypothetical protein DHS20C17_31080 [Cyclobacteriaceae bacterium]